MPFSLTVRGVLLYYEVKKQQLLCACHTHSSNSALWVGLGPGYIHTYMASMYYNYKWMAWRGHPVEGEGEGEGEG